MGTTVPPQTVAPRARSVPVPRAQLDRTRALRSGVLGALAMAFVSAIGMVATFDRRLLVVPVLSLGFAVLYAVPLVAGYVAAAPTNRAGPPTAPPPGPARVAAGAIAGAVSAIGPLVLVFLLGTELDLRGAFPNMSPALRDMLLFGSEGSAGVLLVLVATTAVGSVGASLHLLSDRLRRAAIVGLEVVFVLTLLELVMRQLLGNLGLGVLHRAMYVSNSGLRVVPAIVVFGVGAAAAYAAAGRGRGIGDLVREHGAHSRPRAAFLVAVGLALLVAVPALAGSLVNELLVNVGLFMLMAIGLNIVVGYAGLLDLGYVAFFAVGAYAMAVLTSPLSPAFAPLLSWWVALPIVIVLAAVAGLFVGTPVIRLRGDYLAIVTLGFGEIVRILFLSDWLRPYFGGAQGIRRIPGVEFGAFVVQGVDPRSMFYLTAAFVILAAYTSWRLQASRIGRAWAALREDETTAEVMGVDTVKAKLMAFVVGAILASFGGALFAAKVGTVFPHSFDLLVSIIVLVVVIVGGMGHIPGVMVGAIVLIGVLGGPTQPGLLQELGEYKLLIYGALLVYMMLQRPEGLVPSVRRQRELHQDEFDQDAWFEKKGRFVEADGPAVADGPGSEA